MLFADVFMQAELNIIPLNSGMALDIIDNIKAEPFQVCMFLFDRASIQP